MDEAQQQPTNDDVIGTTRRLSDAAHARVKGHAQRLAQAQAALNDCVTDLLIGMGVDLDAVDVQLSPDARAVILMPKSAPTGERGE